MFNWKKDKISSKLTDTFIGEGTIVEGTIRSEGGIRLEGQLRGDLSCKGDLVVGESGFAVSNMTANNVILAGQVTGNVHITGKMTITATGKLYGDLTAATLTIEDGGVFQGKSTMDQDEPILLPLDRRGGADRRSGIDTGYTGPERRNGIDRRTGLGVDGEVAAVPKKLSFRGPTAVDTDEAQNMADVDPIKERGRAFLSSMSENGGGVRASGDEMVVAGERKGNEQPSQAQTRLSEGLNENERAALSSVVLTEAVTAAVALGENEVAAGVDGGVLVVEADSLGAGEHVTLDASEPVTLDASEPVTLDSSEPVTLNASEPITLDASEPITLDASEPITLDADVAVEPVALGAGEPVTLVADVAVEPVALGASEHVTLDTSEPVTLGAGEPVTLGAGEHVTLDARASSAAAAKDSLDAMNLATPVSGGDEKPASTGNIYGYGFEERANGSTTITDSERDPHSKPSNGRSAAEAAALLKNW